LLLADYVRRATLLATFLILASWLVLGATPGTAGRFGPPWMSYVVVDQTLVREQADPSAAVIGPLTRGALVVVIGEQQSPEGVSFTRTTLGYVPAEDLRESIDPWVADVTAASAAVYSKPNARDAVRMHVKEGELLRVTGVSAGMNGDANLWWSTTEGYVALDALSPSTNPWASQWTVPDGVLAIHGWWGRTNSSANVRAGPSTEAPTIGQFAGGQLLKVLVDGPGEEVEGSSTWYRIDGGRYAGGWVHSSLISRADQPRPNTTEPRGGSSSGRWIVVDRRQHSLTLVEQGEPVFTTYVALGVAGRETPTGTYSTWGKYRADNMTSRSVRDPGGYYDLPNVPDTQYYRDGGFALHGTYWHDVFGTDESHGCVNVTWADGRFLFSQTLPTVVNGELTTPTGQPATDLVIL
jgi:hypothetical protein